jgi:hypothetical protein
LSRNNELVEVYLANGESEAEIIKGLLENNDIPCMLKFAGMTSSSIFGGSVFAQVSVWVREEDVEAARELLKGEENA